MRRRIVPLILALGLSGCCLASSLEGASVLSDQVNRPATPVLPLDHSLLAGPDNSDAYAPEQVHVTLAGPSAIAISWVTRPLDDPDFASKLAGIQAAADEQAVEAWQEDAANKHHHHHHSHKKKKSDKYREACKHLLLAPLTSTVQIGRSANNYDIAVNGTFTCYASDEYASGALHHVVVGAGKEGPLLPKTTYYYRVGDPARSMSVEFKFRMPQRAGADQFPLRIALIGDLGQTKDSHHTLRNAAAYDPDFVLNVGDLSYADGFQPRWDTFARLAQPFATSVPWMVIEGNHEKELINGEHTFLAWESRYYVPARESGSDSPLYYSYDVGPAHVIMLGSYALTDKHSPQYAWLLDDLARFDRSRTPWLIAAMHCPWYNSNTAHYGECDDMQDVMEAKLFEHGVDLMFAGHVHAYERMHRVFHNSANPCGPVHITIGDGGNWEGLDTKYLRQPDWSAYREPSFGHGMLTLINASAARWEWHRNVDGKRVVGDDLHIWRVEGCNGGLAGGSGAAEAGGSVAAV